MSNEIQKLQDENEKLKFKNIELMELNKYLKRQESLLKQERSKFYNLQKRMLHILRENVSLWNIIKIYEKKTQALENIEVELLFKLNDLPIDYPDEELIEEGKDDEIESEFGIVIDNKIKNMSLEELLMSFSGKK